MQKKLFLIISCFFLCLFTGCSCNEKTELKKETIKETEIEEETEKNIDINLDVEESKKEETQIKETQKEDSKKLKIILDDKEYDAGEAKVGKYRKLEHDVQKQEVTDELVKQKLQMMYQSVDIYSYLKTSGTANRGDRVNLSFIARLEGTDKVLDKSAEKGLNLKLGSHSYYEGFDEGIYGMSVGETKKFVIDYETDIIVSDRIIKGNIIEYEVSLNGIYQETTPVAEFGTDEFVKNYLSYTGCNTVAELTAYVRDELEKEMETNYRNEITNILLTQLLESSTIKDYSAELGQAYYQKFLENFKNNAREQNLPIDKFCELNNTTYPEVDEELNEKAIRCLKADIILTKIAEKEGLKSKDEALNLIIESSIYNEKIQIHNVKSFYNIDYIITGN